MFDHLIHSNNLEKYFKMYDLDDEDIIFVKEQIRGPVESEFQSQAQVCSTRTSRHHLV